MGDAFIESRSSSHGFSRRSHGHFTLALAMPARRGLGAASHSHNSSREALAISRPRTQPSASVRCGATSADCHGPAQQFFERRCPAIGDAARHDQIEIAQVGRNVVGKAMRGDPAADVHADGAKLFFRRIVPQQLSLLRAARLARAGISPRRPCVPARGTPRCQTRPSRGSWPLQAAGRTRQHRGEFRRVARSG